MNKKICYILGTVFIISGGFIYTIERAVSSFEWIGQMLAAKGGGSFPAFPQLPGFFTNVFIPLFIIIGIAFFLYGCKLNGK